ncbi:hypothetical protein RB601_008211 [Gaeumannomyces tritici]
MAQLFKILTALRVFSAVEDSIYQSLMRRPGFHHFVGRIQREVDELQNGPHPNAPPLRPGEATEDPSRPGSSFMRHFVDEVRNQIRGTPSEIPPPPPPPPPQPGSLRRK